MKLLFTVLACIVSFNCFSQLLIGATPSQLVSINKNQNFAGNIGVKLYPHQITEFEIHIYKPGNQIIIMDDNGKILNCQKNEIGHFKIITSNLNKYIIIYDKKGFNHEKLDTILNDYKRQLPNDYYHHFLNFGQNDAIVKIKVILTSIKSDTTNKHFVRFLTFTEPTRLGGNFSISTEKIPPPNFRTEPIFDYSESRESNFIVDKPTYLTFKLYILNHKSQLNSDTVGVRNLNFSLEINIDFQHRYYLNARRSIFFLTDFLKYLKHEKINGIYNDEMANIIKYAQYGILNAGKLPPEPN